MNVSSVKMEKTFRSYKNWAQADREPSQNISSVLLSGSRSATLKKSQGNLYRVGQYAEVEIVDEVNPLNHFEMVIVVNNSRSS